jgi:hypothetical protein
MRRLVLVVLLSACGPNFMDDVLITDASVPGFDATTNDASPFGDATIEAEAATVFNGGGPFLCDDCICDGTLHACRIYTGRGHAPLDDASFEAGACAADSSVCIPIPINCLPKPSCACLIDDDVAGGCGCTVDPSGNGLVIECVVP